MRSALGFVGFVGTTALSFAACSSSSETNGSGPDGAALDGMSFQEGATAADAPLLDDSGPGAVDGSSASDAASPQDAIATDGSSAGDAALPQDARTPSDSPLSADAPAPSCGADLANDTNNCGACGHSCLGQTCSGGLCQVQEVVRCDSGSANTTIAGIGPTDIWINCGFWVQRADTSTLAAGLRYHPVTVVQGFGSNVSYATVAGNSVFWAEYHMPLEGGVGTETSFVSSPLTSDSAKVLFTLPMMVSPVAFDGTYVYYGRGDQPGLWRANLDGSGPVKIGPIVVRTIGGTDESAIGYPLLQDATSIFGTMQDATGGHSAVRVDKQGAGVTVLDTDPTTSSQTGWFFAPDVSLVYFARTTPSCYMPPFPGVFVASSPGGTEQSFLPSVAVRALAEDSGEIAWSDNDCTADASDLGRPVRAYRPGGSIVQLTQAVGTLNFGTTLAFDAKWLYFDNEYIIERVGR